MGTLFTFARRVHAFALVGFAIALSSTAVNLNASPVEREKISNKRIDALPAPVSLPLGNLNLGVAAFDARVGIGFLMYSEENVHSRFANTPPSQWNADHLIAVVYLNDEWLIDRNEFALEPFTPRPSDRLLVEVDFGANTVNYLAGVDSTIHDIPAGYVSGDLIVTPDTWGGGEDDGEFWIQGSEVIIENTGPSVEIVDGPTNDSTLISNNPLFAWTATDPDGSIDLFTLDLIGPSPSTITTSDTLQQFTDLLNGDYTFCVTAQDNHGEPSAEACRSFAIEVPAQNELPTVQITNGPADSTTITINNPAFTWAGEDIDGIINSYIVKLAGPTPDSFSTTDTFIQYSERQNGEYTFCVQAVDDDEAASDAACRFFIIDVPSVNTPPTVAINNGPAEGSTIDFDNPAFSWNGEDTDGTIDSFYVELRGPSFTAFSTQDTFHQFAGLLNGDHEFCVRASDDQALFSAWACRSFSVFIPTSNLPPTVSIENGPMQGDTLAYNNPAFTWLGEDLDGTVDSFVVDLQGPTPITFTTAATFHQYNALDNGSYSFCIQSKDNLDALSEQVCRAFSLVVPDNNQSPTVTIENGPEDQSVITINNPAFTWIGEDTDGTVESYNIELIGPTALALNVTDTFYQFPPLSSGSYNFCVQAIDDNGALSSFMCRQFDVNSSLTGSLKDVFINKDGAVLQIPMVQQAVDIYQSETFITSTTTDDQGVFVLQGQYGDGSYELQSGFFEKIEGMEATVVIRRAMHILDEQSLEIVVPRTLAIDQFETLNNLSQVTISSEFLEAETEPATLGPMYNVDVLDALLRNWLGNLGSDIDPYLETMQRISLSTAAIERAIGDAAYLSHEQSETLFSMLQVYLTSHEFLSRASAQLTDTGDLNLEDALRFVISHIDDLIYEMAVNTPTRYAAAFTPAPYHRSYFDALVLMYETILQETVFDPGVGTRFSQGFSESSDRNRIKLAANQKLLQDVYLAETQQLIQSITDLSVQFNTQGSFTEAFDEIISTNPSSLASQAEAIVQHALQQSDSLQQNAQSAPAVQLIAALINSQANYTSLNSASIALKTTAFDQAGKALIYTGTGLANLQAFAHQGAIRAFAPDSVFASPSVGTPPGFDGTQVQQDQYTGMDEEAYIAQLDNILWFVEQGNRDVVVTMLDDLTELDRQYEASLAALQGDLWAVAEELISTTPGMKPLYEDMLVARNQSLKHRVQLYVDLLRYAGLQPVSLPVLTAQRDSVAQSLASTGLLSRQIKISLTNVDQPFIALTSHQTATPLVAPGTPSEIVATIQNTGSQPATQLTLTLRADSLVTFLSPPTFIIPTLDPGQETTVRWEFFIQEYVHSGGMYFIEAHLPEEKELFSSGVYKVGIERTVNTSSANEAGIPTEHALHPNFPNPFSTETTIRFDLPEPSEVTITLYDMLGREVINLLHTPKPAGKHSIRLNAQSLPSGTYLLRMQTGEYNHVQSVVVIK